MEMNECEAYGTFGQWSVSQQPMTNASRNEIENTYSNTPQAETAFGDGEDDNRPYEPVMRGVQQVPSRGTHRVVSDEFESRQYCNVISHDAALEERNLADEVTGCNEPHYANQSEITLARQQHSNESS